MNASDTYEAMYRAELTWQVTPEFDLRVGPKCRLTPELREAIGANKGELICKILSDITLTWASREYGLEIDINKMPEATPRMLEAYRERDFSELIDALDEYVLVWKVGTEVFKVLGSTPA